MLLALRPFFRPNAPVIRADSIDPARLRAALERMRAQKIVYRLLSRPTPFAFPLMIERLREQVTTEKLGTRIERMIADLERAATV